MKRLRKKLIVSGLFLIFLFCLIPALVALDDTGDTEKQQKREDSESTVYLSKVVLKDGTEYIGEIVQHTEQVVIMKTHSGVLITIQVDKILKIGPAIDYKEPVKKPVKDPADSRLFFTGTGRTLGKGNSLLSVYEVFFPAFTYGLTDNIDIGIGASVVSGLSEQLLFIAPKLQLYENKGFSLATGLLYLNTTALEGDGGAIVYGVGTIAGKKLSFTGGFGAPLNHSFSGVPVVILGGEYQASRSIKFITENMLFAGDYESVMSFGIRFFSQRISVDLGLIHFFTINEGFPFFPWLGFSYKLGKY